MILITGRFYAYNPGYMRGHLTVFVIRRLKGNSVEVETSNGNILVLARKRGIDFKELKQIKL